MLRWCLGALLGGMLLGGAALADVPHKVLTGGNSKIVYIITPSHTNPMFRQASRMAAKAAKLFGYMPRMVSHEDSPVKQAELFEAAIAERAAAIICDNAGTDATVPAVKRAYDNNIPTFLIDREITELGFAVSQIIADTNKAARELAKLLAESLNYEGEYCELYGRSSDLNALKRSHAFHEVLDEYPKLKCVAVIYANWDKQEALEQMRDVLQKYPNLKGVVSANDGMALGAVAAAKEAFISKLKVVSIDGTEEVREEIKAGNMLATAVQPISELAESAVLQLHRYLETGSTGLQEVQLFDCLLVTKKNVDDINLQIGDTL